MNEITPSAVSYEVPKEVLESPALLFLFYRIEQILGIRAGSDSLIKLNGYLEANCGSTFIENPAAYEYLLTSREQIFSISKFITVNETYFFRESAHFDLLSELLPEIIRVNKSLQVCSAATSIGCEAYSLAMFFDYYKNNGFDFDFSIDAFDISEQVIETAKAGRFTPNTLRGDISSWKKILNSYLIIDNNEYVIPDNIRKNIRFFNHNIMRGLENTYDIIFFRNSLIYFSQRNRYYVINNLVESLNNNGLLFFGISETASAKHPFLSNRYLQEVFYFQKTRTPSMLEKLPDNCLRKFDNTAFPVLDLLSDSKQYNKTSFNDVKTNYVDKNSNELLVNFNEVTQILKKDEGKNNAENLIRMISKNEYPFQLSGSLITAGAIYLLNTEDFEGADKIIALLEEKDSKCYAKFLRGEYYFLQGKGSEAEKYFQEAAIRDKCFWPAFYRIQSLASDGNRIRYEYKIKKALESISLLQNLGSEKPEYECFIGGFSPDYFRRILEKKLA